MESCDKFRVTLAWFEYENIQIRTQTMRMDYIIFRKVHFLKFNKPAWTVNSHLNLVIEIKHTTPVSPVLHFAYKIPDNKNRPFIR